MLRDYQIRAVSEIRSKFINGYKKVMLVAPVGSGKTVIFSHIMQRYAEQNRPCIMVVRGRQLVDQTSERLTIDHGVLMANHPKFKKDALINICSIDTLNSRNIYPRAELVIIDEAHLATSKAYEKLAEHYTQSGSRILAVTATPYTKNSLAHVAEVIVEPVSMQQLIEAGHLVFGKYFVPSRINTKALKMKGGDYSEESSFDAMNSSTIYGSITEAYKMHLLDKPTVCFAVNKKHARNICEQFNQLGITCEVLTDENSLAERKIALEKLACGETKIIANVGILTTGVDMPWLLGIIMARPTVSVNLYIQMLGRGTRPYRDKNHFIVLDHANNYMRHGPIELERPCEISTEKRKEYTSKFSGDFTLIICESCYFAFKKEVGECPHCRAVVPKKETKIKVTNAEMVQAAVKIYHARTNIKSKASELIREAVEKKYKFGWVYFRLKAIYAESQIKTNLREFSREYKLLQAASINSEKNNTDS